MQNLLFQQQFAKHTPNGKLNAIHLLCAVGYKMAYKFMRPENPSAQMKAHTLRIPPKEERTGAGRWPGRDSSSVQRVREAEHRARGVQTAQNGARVTEQMHALSAT